MITQQQPYSNTRADAPFSFLGLPTILRATAETTSGAFGLVEALFMPPGFASPYHVHHREDEAFYVLEGQIAFICDGKWLVGRPGDYVFGPRELPHGFKVVGDTPARMLLLCAPAGFEQFVLELSQPAGAAPAPPDMEKLVAVAARHHIDVLGPLPEWVDEGAAVGKTDRQLIDDLRNAHLAAMNHRDSAAFVRLFADDAVQMPPDSPANTGKAAIAAWIEPFMQTCAIRFALAVSELQMLGDRAVETGSYTLELTPDGASSSVTQTGKYISIYERLATGKWAIARDIWNTDQPFRMG